MKKIVWMFLLASGLSFGQDQAPTKTIAKKGSFFVYWGWNRSLYSTSDIHFSGNNYDFTLDNVEAKDRQSPFSAKIYLNPGNITIPQYNFRLGYYLNEKYSISFGADHMKYVMVHNTPYLLTGKINAGVDNVTNWSGSYAGDSILTDEQTFHYENTNGMNYLRLEMAKLRVWYRSRSGNFAFTTLLGGSVGGILSFNDFTFAGRKDLATVSMSGLGISGHLGGRFEFFKHFFVQMNAATGFMMQSRVKTRPNDYDSYARQRFGYASGEFVIGGLFYIRPKNDCNSCPNW